MIFQIQFNNKQLSYITRKLIKTTYKTFKRYLNFSSGFQVIYPSNYDKMLKSHKSPGHYNKNMLSKVHNSLRTGKIKVTT